MNHFRPIVVVAILAFVTASEYRTSSTKPHEIAGTSSVVNQSSESTIRSTTVGKTTLQYRDDVAEPIAQQIAQLLSESKLLGTVNLVLELRQEADGYPIRLQIVLDEYPEEGCDAFAFFARMVTDRASLDKPLVFELVKDSTLIASIPAIGPMGNLCFRNNDCLYYSENITAADAERMMDELISVGYFHGEFSMARMDLTDTGYVLRVCMADDAGTPGFDERINSNALLFQRKLVQDAGLELVYCKKTLEPIDGLNCKLEPQP